MTHRSLLFAGQGAGNAFQDDILSCAKMISERYATNRMLGINLFFNATSETDFFEKKNHIKETFGNLFGLLPVNAISQPAGEQIAAEIWTSTEPIESLQHKSLDGTNYTVFSNAFGQSLFSLGLTHPTPGLSMKEQSASAFETMCSLLAAEKFSMDEVIRQWNYIPEILKENNSGCEVQQHYQIFNDVREQYYSAFKKETLYPAATGIGMTHGNITIDFLATRPGAESHCINLANPRQIDAFDYSQGLLVGSASDKKPPLFARAKLIGNARQALAFVSGTASIIGEETRAIGDVAMQTRITIENIEQLVSKENYRQNTGNEAKNISPKFNRVYIKHAADFATVQEICENHYGNVPTLYVLADVCRDNLLVEIESEIEIIL